MPKEQQLRYTPVFEIQGLREEMSAVPEETQEFVLTCIEEGLFEKLRPRTKKDQLDRNIEITLQYFLGDETEEELGQQHNITRQRVSIVIENTLKALWNNAPIKIQEHYDPDTFLLEKQYTVISGKQADQRIRELKKQGFSSEEILEKLGLLSQDLHGLRYRARKFGITIPTLTIRSKYENYDLAELLTEEKDEEVVRKLLAQVEERFYKDHSKGSEPILIPLRRITDDLFYNIQRKRDAIINALMIRGIPVGMVERRVVSGKHEGLMIRYFFISAQHETRAREVLETDPDLDRYRISPVQQIAGIKREKLPTTTELFLDKEHYGRVGTLLEQFGIRIRGNSSNRVDAEEFLNRGDCPVPVYRYSDGIYYPIDQEETLIAYIQDQLGDKE